MKKFFLIYIILNSTIINSQLNFKSVFNEANNTLKLVDSLLESTNSIDILREKVYEFDTIYLYSNKKSTNITNEKLNFNGVIVKVEKKWFDSLQININSLWRYSLVNSDSFRILNHCIIIREDKNINWRIFLNNYKSECFIYANNGKKISDLNIDFESKGYRLKVEDYFNSISIEGSNKTKFDDMYIYKRNIFIQSIGFRDKTMLIDSATYLDGNYVDKYERWVFRVYKHKIKYAIQTYGEGGSVTTGLPKIIMPKRLRKFDVNLFKKL
jgi:hypothetical protein